jgi:hypothetical protein
MDTAFEHRTVITRRALICAVLLSVLPMSAVDANVSSARLTIKDGAFGRTNVVVLKGGTLTIKNADSVAYRIKVGATVVVITAMGSKTVPLPQRGTFSITCAKVPSLRATLIVK